MFTYKRNKEVILVKARRNKEGIWVTSNRHKEGILVKFTSNKEDVLITSKRNKWATWSFDFGVSGILDTVKLGGFELEASQ